MGLGKILIIMLLLALPAIAAQELVLKVDCKADQVKDIQDLGNMQVAGIGSVKLIAGRQGNQLVVQALGPDEKVIGRAESVTGTRETPITLMTPKGLQTLIVIWESR